MGLSPGGSGIFPFSGSSLYRLIFEIGLNNLFGTFNILARFRIDVCIDLLANSRFLINVDEVMFYILTV